MKVDEKQMARDIKAKTTMDINTTELQRHLFGWFKWRFRLGMGLIAMGTKVLGYTMRVDPGPPEEASDGL